jgi:hypothetical protein
MIRPVLGGQLAFSDGALLAQFGAPPKLTGFLIVLPLAELFSKTTPLEQFLKAAQRSTNLFPVVYPHPQRHAFSLKIPGPEKVRKGSVVLA